jgi:hypothetical protein
MTGLKPQTLTPFARSCDCAPPLTGRHYITTWFLVDVLALNPVGYVTTFLRDHGTSVSESLRLLEVSWAVPQCMA